MEVEEDEVNDDDDNGDDDDDDDEDPQRTIPPDLLTRILHEFFEKDGTRITKDANNAMAKYMDVFVKEAIARSAAERDRGFLEVCVARNAVAFGDHSVLTTIYRVYRSRIWRRLRRSFCWTCEKRGSTHSLCTEL